MVRKILCQDLLFDAVLVGIVLIGSAILSLWLD